MATNVLGVKGKCPAEIAPAPKPGQILAFVNGQVTWIDPSISPLTLNPDGSLTYVNESGTVTTIPAATLTNTVDGHVIGTYTNSAGVAVDIKESVISVVVNADGSATITNEDGVAVTIPCCAPTVSNTVAGHTIGTLTYAGGAAVDIKETITTITGAQAGGHTIGTYTNEAGVAVDIKESVISIVNNPDGTTTITDEIGNAVVTGHPAASFTNNAAPFSWNAATQSGNIPQAGKLVDNGDGTYTFTPGDGTDPTTIKTCCPPDLFYANTNPNGPQTVEIVSGGVAPFTYAWTVIDTATGATVTTSAAASPTFNWAALGGACGKLIRVTVTDATGATSTSWQYAKPPLCMC